MPPAARLGDNAQVQSDAHGCPSCPHPGIGPITTGSPDVFINKRPAARKDDLGIHAICCGPNIYNIAKGSPNVYVNGKPLARKDDKTKHCGGDGPITEGSPDVMVNDGASASGLANYAINALKILLAQAEKMAAAEAQKLSDQNKGKSKARGGGGAGGGGGGKADGKQQGGKEEEVKATGESKNDKRVDAAFKLVDPQHKPLGKVKGKVHRADGAQTSFETKEDGTFQLEAPLPENEQYEITVDEAPVEEPPEQTGDANGPDPVDRDAHGGALVPYEEQLKARSPKVWHAVDKGRRIHLGRVPANAQPKDPRELPWATAPWPLDLVGVAEGKKDGKVSGREVEDGLRLERIPTRAKLRVLDGEGALLAERSFRRAIELCWLAGLTEVVLEAALPSGKTWRARLVLPTASTPGHGFVFLSRQAAP